MDITKEWLQKACDESTTTKEIIISLGLDPYSGGAYRTVKKYITSLEIDTTAFDSRKKVEIGTRLANTRRNGRKYTIDTVFTRCEIRVDGKTLKQLMLEAGFNYMCVECGNTGVYNGKPLTLQIDHIDGDCLNNNKGNLRFLCPNCHTQTPTFGSKNRKSKKRNRQQYNADKTKKLIEINQPLIDKVKASNIDFTSYGWSGAVAAIIEKPPQNVTKWMRKYMPDAYATCFKRKQK